MDKTTRHKPDRTELDQLLKDLELLVRHLIQRIRELDPRTYETIRRQFLRDEHRARTREERSEK
jgi:hypothetical protein